MSEHIPTLTELRESISDDAELYDAACRARDLHVAAMEQVHRDANGEALTASAQRRWDVHDGALRALDGFVRERQRQALAEVVARRTGTRSIETAFGAYGGATADVDPVRGEARAVVDHARRLLEDRTAARHLRDEQREYVERSLRTTNGDTDGTSIARLIAATERPAYRSAFMKYAAGGFAFTAEETAAIAEVRSLSIGTPSAGGLAVPALIDPTIVWTAQGSSNPILGRARVETITGNKWLGISSAGMTWTFATEGAEVADNSPSIAQPEIDTHKAQGFIKYSIEVEQDWPGFAAAMSETFTRGYDELLAQVFVTGTTGSNQPDGIVSQLTATTTSQVTLTTAGTLGKVDVYRMWAALPERARMAPAATWMSSTDVQNKVRALGDNPGDAFTVNLTADGIPALFGRPYPINDYFPAFPTGTTTSAIAVVGDFSQYLIAMRAGMSVEQVPLTLGSNRRPDGNRGLYGWTRVGAGVVDPGGFRMLVNKTS
ncbi:phage major capsid protein [Frankia sp. ACN1ag]|uniref:phage major capsid protein n=1 Tax=Frankia sp. ACN1ag TaxID=102891 RepID=UPI0006DCA798|nr:phage major capsid protein [Frankia sp. ACN1ag]